MSHIDQLKNMSNRNQLSDTMRPNAERTREQRIVRLNCDQVVPREQTRKSFENIDELAETIKKKGQQQPIRVMRAQGNADAEYEIIMGERRWRACKQLGIPVYAIITPRIEDHAELTAIELIENLQREDLSPFELANGLATLSASNLTNREIAHQISKSEAYVSRHLKLQRAPSVIRTLYDQGYSKDTEVFVLLVQLWQLDQRAAESFVAGLSEDVGVSRKDVREVLKAAKSKGQDNCVEEGKLQTSPQDDADIAQRLQKTTQPPTEDGKHESESDAEQGASSAPGGHNTPPPSEPNGASRKASSSSASVRFQVSFVKPDAPDSHLMGTLMLEPGPQDDLLYVMDGGGEVHTVNCEDVSILACMKNTAK